MDYPVTLNTGYFETGFRDFYIKVGENNIKIDTDTVHQPAFAYDVGCFMKLIEEETDSNGKIEIPTYSDDEIGKLLKIQITSLFSTPSFS